MGIKYKLTCHHAKNGITCKLVHTFKTIMFLCTLDSQRPHFKNWLHKQATKIDVQLLVCLKRPRLNYQKLASS